MIHAARDHERAVYPLSSLQAGMLVHHLRAPRSGVDIEQIVCALSERADEAHLRAVWQQTLDRHDVLRTSFVWEGLDTPRQETHERLVLPWESEDWRMDEPAAREARLTALLSADRARGFDLAAPPLMRMMFIRWSDAESRLLWTFHHVLLDGRSFPMLLRETFDAYDAAQNDEPAPPVAARRA